MDKSYKISDAFNARYMTFTQVAESFIETSDFNKILSNNHTLLIGSRGCGKTTLLKMLHPLAVVKWDELNSGNLINRIPFFGVYIPSDKQWGKQIEVFENRFSDYPLFVKNISRGLVNLNILIAICDSFKSLLSLAFNNEDLKTNDIKISLELINLWKLPKPITPNLYSISQKFLSFVDDLNIIANKGDTDSTLQDYCYWDFINKIEIAINAFEEYFKDYDFFNNKPFKWALCFDELEIAPRWLFDELVSNDLRSRCQKIIIKMTTIPSVKKNITKEISKSTPSFGDDYDPLQMWIYDKRSQTNWRAFCESYLNKTIQAKFGKKIKTIAFFGVQDYNLGLKESDKSKFSKLYKLKEDSEFQENGIMWYVMKELAKIDRSFHMYLLKKDINPLNPVPLRKEQIDQVHRKIKPIVLYRYYLKAGDRKRSRKVISFNHGKDFIYDLADGNPRALVNIVNYFLPEMKLNSHGDPIKIPINTQATIIHGFCNDYFYPRVAYYSDGSVKVNGKTITIEDLINSIGNFFKNQYLDNDFNADPSSRIRFTKCPAQIETLFNKCLEAGGIIEDEIESNKRKKITIYRLSYSLFPYFELPQRAYSPRNLNEIIEPLLSNEKTNDLQMKIQY